MLNYIMFVNYLTGFSRIVCSIKLNDNFTFFIITPPRQSLSKYKAHSEHTVNT